MSNNHWTWTVTKRLAARLIAIGDLSLPEIAVQCETCRETISNWKNHKKFQDEIDAIAKEVDRKVALRCIAQSAEHAVETDQLAVKISAIVAQMTEEQLKKLNESPATAINLLLRLRKEANASRPRRSPTDSIDDEYPFDTEFGPEDAAKVLAILTGSEPPEDSE